MALTNSQKTLLALDIGEKRIGVAIATLDSKLPRPLVTLINDQELINNLRSIIEGQQVEQIVAGLPRGLDGQETAQTAQVRSIVKDIEKELGIILKFQDEALTSVKAEEELSSHGKIYQKADVDKLAATYILQDYINEHLS
jgi:putative holliday junction resolvase